MSNIQATFFDYAELDTETRIVVQQRTSEIKALMKRAASDIIDIGGKLIEVKARLPHGAFLPWFESELGFERTMATKFMQVAERFGSADMLKISTFAPSALYLLAAPSTPESARAEAIERAESGEAISYSTARDLVQEHKTEEAQLQRQYDGMPMVVPPDYEDEPLTPYEQSIASSYQSATEYIPVMPQSMRMLTSQETTEWYTPQSIIEIARLVLGGIDLDPASSDMAQQWISAGQYYTADRPIVGTWAGRVWLNPPFDNTPAWVDRLDSEYQNGDVTAAILLVNSAPGYIWWEELWRRRPVCLLRERLCFIREDGTPGGQAKKGTTIAYYGSDVRRFADHFRALGRVILPEDVP